MPFGQKAGQPQVQTTQPVLTPEQQAAQSSALGIAQRMGGQGPNIDPNLLAAIQAWQQYQGAGGTALQGIMGNSNIAQQFLNPQLSMLNPTFDYLRQQAASRAGLATTSPFGIGNREGLTAATMMGDINRQQEGMTYQASQDAFNRMMGIYNVGQGATNNLGLAGQYLTELPMNWARGQVGLLNEAMGPTGSRTTTPTTQNWLSTVLGVGALAAAPFTGGASAAAAPGLLNEEGTGPPGFNPNNYQLPPELQNWQPSIYPQRGNITQGGWGGG